MERQHLQQHAEDFKLEHSQLLVEVLRDENNAHVQNIIQLQTLLDQQTNTITCSEQIINKNNQSIKALQKNNKAMAGELRKVQELEAQKLVWTAQKEKLEYYESKVAQHEREFQEVKERVEVLQKGSAALVEHLGEYEKRMLAATKENTKLKSELRIRNNLKTRITVSRLAGMLTSGLLYIIVIKMVSR